MLSLIHFYGYNILPFPNVNKFSPLKSKTRAFANNKSHIYLAKMEQERSMDISLKDLSKQLEDFAKVGEVGELSEIFQWRGEVDKGLPNWEESDKEHLGEELSDVLLYLIRLADICGIDLAHAATKKILKNSIKYPEPKVFLRDEDSYN
nr:uncharacterized protein LOC101256037 isoform X1 [Solanum lycopersicum]